MKRHGLQAVTDAVETSFQDFFSHSFSAGVSILVFAAIAMLWANSPWQYGYEQFRHNPVQITFINVHLNFTFEHFVNDGLMVLFFLLVGLEIKREMFAGELSSRRKALLPMIGALSGMAFPGLIYLLFNAGLPSVRGWGVPVATDIAFALGILALLGKGVPAGLTVFLAALAIVDDLLSVLVIALFYSGSLNIPMLAGAAVILGLLVLCNRAGIYKMWVYVVLGIALWVCVLYSGIHATVAGVLLALAIPAEARIHASTFIARATRLMERIASHTPTDEDEGLQMDAVHALEKQCEQVQTPLQRMERGLHTPVSFLILPLFALVNAGVPLQSEMFSALASPVALGIMGGLFIGKQFGVTLAVWLSVRLGIADLPQHVSMRQIHGVSLLCGIGFTMALFVGQLAFSDLHDLDVAKLAIVAGSTFSAVAGFLLLRRSIPKDIAA